MSVISYEVPINAQRMTIGVQGENKVREFLFDVTEWRQITGNIGAAEMVVQRAGDSSPYATAITMKDENTVSWVPTEVDTAKAGAGKIELMWIANNQTIKTKIFLMKVNPSLPYAVPDDSLDPWESWMPGIINADANYKGLTSRVDDIQKSLTSPYNFRGALASAAALPAASAENANDTYYLIAEKYRVTSNGEDWVQSSMDESEYADELTQVKVNASEGGTVNLLTEVVQPNKVSGGITWELLPGFRVKVTGTATATSLYHIYSVLPVSSFPSWLVPGRTYHLEYDSPSRKVAIRAYVTTESNPEFHSIYDKYVGGDFTLPADVTTFYLRLVVSGRTQDVSETVAPRIWSTMRNDELAAVADRVGTLPEWARASSARLRPHTDSFLAIGETLENKDISANESVYGQWAASTIRLNTVFTSGQDMILRCDDGYKFKIADVDPESGLVSSWPSAWSTENFLAAGVMYRLAVAHTDSDTKITPAESIHLYADTIGDMVEQAIETFDGIGWSLAFAPYYKYFAAKLLLAADGNISLRPNMSYYRVSAVINLERPLTLRMMNVDYQFRLYWYEGEVLCSTSWGDNWDVPAGIDVGITIKRSQYSSNPESLAGEAPHLFLSAVDDLAQPKSYFLEELADTVAKVRAANTEPGLCFLLSTDQHDRTVQGTRVKYDTITDMAINMRALCREIHVDGNISLGDLTDFKVPGDMSDGHNRAIVYGVPDEKRYDTDYLDKKFTEWAHAAMDKLASVHPNLIYVAGNHDDNRYINNDYLKQTVSGYDFSAGEMYSYYAQRSQLRRVPNMDNNGLDYFIDYPDVKIRVFAVHASHWYDDQEARHTTAMPADCHDCWWYGYNDSTVTWMREQLALVPDGWSVLLLSHTSPIKDHNPDFGNYPNVSAMESVIRDFVDGGGDYIATLYGHSHVDWAATDPWLEISFAAQKCVTGTTADIASMTGYSNLIGAEFPERTAGTATEDCWNVVIIQPISRKIKVIRFGAGEDREFSY